MYCLHQSDGNPTIDVSASSGVGILTLCFKASGYPFQSSRLLHTQYPVNGGGKRQNVDVAAGMPPSTFSSSLGMPPEDTFLVSLLDGT